MCPYYNLSLRLSQAEVRCLTSLTALAPALAPAPTEATTKTQALEICREALAATQAVQDRINLEIEQARNLPDVRVRRTQVRYLLQLSTALLSLLTAWKGHQRQWESFAS